MTLIVLRTIHMFFRTALDWDLSDAFLSRLGWWVFEMKITDGNCYVHYIISKIHTINITYHFWYGPWSPGWGSVCRISPQWSYYSPPSLSHTPLKAVTTQSPHIRSEELCSTFLRAENLHKFLRILLDGWSLLSPFIYSIIYLY